MQIRTCRTCRWRVPGSLLGLTLALAACGGPGSPSTVAKEHVATRTFRLEATSLAQADATVLVNGAGDAL